MNFYLIQLLELCDAFGWENSSNACTIKVDESSNADELYEFTLLFRRKKPTPLSAEECRNDHH